jgi:hypothetical protein
VIVSNVIHGNVTATVRTLTLTVNGEPDAKVLTALHRIYGRRGGAKSAADLLAVGVLANPGELTPVAMLVDEVTEVFAAEKRGERFVSRERLVAHVTYLFRLLLETYSPPAEAVGLTETLLRKCGVNTKRIRSPETTLDRLLDRLPPENT